MSFRDTVISVVQRIPEGKVTTYGTIAALAGLPRGARLVGGIMHNYSTKHEEEIPWFRVINRKGFISIKCFDHPKGLQKALLEQEGIEVSEDYMVNLQKYGWFGERSVDYSKLEKS